jgi:hypothetical protein
MIRSAAASRSIERIGSSRFNRVSCVARSDATGSDTPGCLKLVRGPRWVDSIRFFPLSSAYQIGQVKGPASDLAHDERLSTALH